MILFRVFFFRVETPKWAMIESSLFLYTGSHHSRNLSGVPVHGTKESNRFYGHACLEARYVTLSRAIGQPPDLGLLTNPGQTVLSFACGSCEPRKGLLILTAARRTSGLQSWERHHVIRTGRRLCSSVYSALPHVVVNQFGWLKDRPRLTGWLAGVLPHSDQLMERSSGRSVS